MGTTSKGRTTLWQGVTRQLITEVFSANTWKEILIDVTFGLTVTVQKEDFGVMKRNKYFLRSEINY